MNTQLDIDNILLNLKEGQYVAFGYNYFSNEPKEIMVTNITKVYEDRVLVHFLWGHHSCGEFIKKEDIIAVGDHSASGKIKGWSGRFNILQPNHEILKEDEDEQ